MDWVALTKERLAPDLHTAWTSTWRASILSRFKSQSVGPYPTHWMGPWLKPNFEYPWKLHCSIRNPETITIWVNSWCQSQSGALDSVLDLDSKDLSINSHLAMKTQKRHVCVSPMINQSWTSLISQKATDLNQLDGTWKQVSKMRELLRNMREYWQSIMNWWASEHWERDTDCSLMMQWSHWQKFTITSI